MNLDKQLEGLELGSIDLLSRLLSKLKTRFSLLFSMNVLLSALIIGTPLPALFSAEMTYESSHEELDEEEEFDDEDDEEFDGDEFDPIQEGAPVTVLQEKKPQEEAVILKKAPVGEVDLKQALAFNEQVGALKIDLRKLYDQAQDLIHRGVNERELLPLYHKIKALKEEIAVLEEEWRITRLKEASREEEGYIFWDHGETSIAQLVMEYGSSDFLYVIPPEVGILKLQLYSMLPLPHASRDEMVESLLHHNGIGVKRINSFTKQLYLAKNQPAAVKAIVQLEGELGYLADNDRIIYVFSPEVERLKPTQLFFEKFSDPKQTLIQSIGTKILIVSTTESVKRLLELYKSVYSDSRGREVKVIALRKLPIPDGEKILKEFFHEGTDKGRGPYFKYQGDELKVIALPQESSLLLIGDSDLIERATEVIEDIESQVDDPSEMTILWYTCKHSDPQDVAEVLSQVYSSLSRVHADSPAPKEGAPTGPPINISCKPGRCYKTDPPFSPVLPVKLPMVEPGVIRKDGMSAYGNFIVDARTGSILMVVRKEEVGQLNSLLEKLDVPKRMVQIDVLLVEKRNHNQAKIGLDLLNIGSTASGTRQSAISFNDVKRFKNRGLLEFILSRPQGDFPAFDLTYHFLLAQENIEVNANPSVLAINQTPATISIVDEISINNGAVPIDTPAGGVAVEKSYTRAQYGTTLVMTPTIHLPDPLDEEAKGFVTLHTNVTFDTPGISIDDRPPVARRHIENEVRVADGETIILGGLRRKSQEEDRRKIPFLGDIPGFGKLFSLNHITDSCTDIIVFITPRIIRDPIDGLREARRCKMQERVGDIPEFLDRLRDAKQKQKERIFEQSFKLLFDKLG